MATPTTSSARKPHNNSNSSLTPILNSLLKTNWKKRPNSTRTPLRFAGINPTPPSSAVTPKPHFDSSTKKVILLDWWLIKVQVEGSGDFRFGVEGNACDGQASMYFCSGEIVKRHDEMSLETVEGITITLASLLNRIRTLENDFPSQVCDHFFLGFPFDWQEFGAQYFGEQSIHEARSSKGTRMSLDDIDDPKCLLSSFDDIPVTRLFDHMMVSSGGYDECPLTKSIFDDILSEYGSSSAKLNEEDTDQLVAEDSLPNVENIQVDRVLGSSRSKNCTKPKQLGNDSTTKRGTISAISMSGQDLNKSSGVLTRSKARSKKLRTDLKDITAEPDVTAEESAVYLVKTKKISDPCPTSGAEKSEKDASSRHVTNKFSKVNNPLLDRPGVRRSGRKRKALSVS